MDRGLRFLHRTMVNMNPTVVVGPEISGSDLRGASVGTGKAKRKGAVMTVATLGVAGAAYHVAKGRGMVPLLVLAERPEGWMTLRFGVRGPDADAVIATLNDVRRNRGERALGAAHQDHAQSAAQVPAQLQASTDVGSRLRTLKKMHDAGLVTAAEFEAKRHEILSEL
jgi:Short C-terminal domain